MNTKFRVSIAGFLFYYLVPLRRKIVLNNINQVFQNQLTEKEKKNLAKSFYSHVASTLKELLFLRRYLKKNANTWGEIRGWEFLLEAISQGRGCFILGAHLGNWELALILLCSRTRTKQVGIGCNVIRKSVRIQWIERFIFNHLEQYGIKIIPSSGAVTKIMHALKNKELIILTLDQHAQLKNKEGIPVDFFKRQAGTYRSLAFFVNKYQVPVIPWS